MLLGKGNGKKDSLVHLPMGLTTSCPTDFKTTEKLYKYITMFVAA